MAFLFDTTPPDTAPARRRALDNPRVLIAAALLLIAMLGGLFWLSERTTEIALPLLTDVILYALLAVDVALLVALFFVLARNLLKLWVEQRRSAPFARFRAKLVAALLAMTIIPAVLVLISGSGVIRNVAARWFSPPVDRILLAAQTLATAWFRDHQDEMRFRAERLAAAVPANGEADLDRLVNTELATMRDGMIEVYRAVTEPGRPPEPLRNLPFQPDKRGRIRKPSRELRDAVIDSLLEAVGPLGDKLGAILVQLPPYVVSGAAQREELGRILSRLAPARAASLSASWRRSGNRPRPRSLDV